MNFVDIQLDLAARLRARANELKETQERKVVSRSHNVTLGDIQDRVAYQVLAEISTILTEQMTDIDITHFLEKIPR